MIEIWDDVGNSSEYLYIANAFNYCYKSCMMAKYNGLAKYGLAKSSLCGAGAQILFVTLVACQRGTKNIWAFPISFTSSVGKLSWHLIGFKVHLIIREEYGKAVLAGLIPFLKKHHFFHKLSQNWERFEVVICHDALLFLTTASFWFLL